MTTYSLFIMNLEVNEFHINNVFDYCVVLILFFGSRVTIVGLPILENFH
jgi:hypothetical protein